MGIQNLGENLRNCIPDRWSSRRPSLAAVGCSACRSRKRRRGWCSYAGLTRVPRCRSCKGQDALAGPLSLEPGDLHPSYLLSQLRPGLIGIKCYSFIIVLFIYSVNKFFTCGECSVSIISQRTDAKMWVYWKMSKLELNHQ